MRPSALLLDLDGTIYQGKTLISGAKEILVMLEDAGIPYCFITNTTRMTKKKLVFMLRNLGLYASMDNIFAAPHAAVLYCKNRGYKKILLVVQDGEMEEDFSEFQMVDYKPEAIVLGDMGASFTFNLINNLFLHILDGAELVAMHKNRFWKSADGYTLDMGAFVSALEYASGKQASIMGKPNSNLFVLASQKWNIPAGEILVVGDDVDSDVVGALNAGMKSVLVKTGKFRSDDFQSSGVRPNYIIDSIADLPNVIDLG